MGGRDGMAEQRIACVYQIVNTVNGKRYVGSTIDFYRRQYNHFHDLRKGRHHSKSLQDDYNRYGEEAFAVRIIELVENHENLFDREQHYIDAFKPEYNVMMEAGAVPDSLIAWRTRKARGKTNGKLPNPEEWPWLRRELVTRMRLSKKERLVLDLRYGERLTWKEIDDLRIPGLSARTGNRILKDVINRLKRKAEIAAAHEQEREQEKLFLGVINRVP